MKDLTDKPWGVNIAQAFVRDPNIAEFVIDQGVRFVTTSAGSPTRYTEPLKAAGLTVFHVVPTLKAALKAIGDGSDRILLTLATGTGKTSIAFQIAWKLFQTRWNRSEGISRRPRILFLADRNILANQAYNSFLSLIHI